MKIRSGAVAAISVLLLTGCAAAAPAADPLTKDEACEEFSQWAADNPALNIDAASSKSMQKASDYFLTVAKELTTLSDRVKDSEPLFAGILADAAEPHVAAADAASGLAEGDTGRFSEFTDALTVATTQIGNVTTACN